MRASDILTELGEIFVTELQPALGEPEDGKESEKQTKAKDEVFVSDIITYTQPAFKNQLLVLTDQKQLLALKVKIKKEEDSKELVVDYQLVQKLPLKHFAHTMLELGCGDFFVTISHQSIEYWDLGRKKRLGLFYTHLGENLLAICLNSQTNQLLQGKKQHTLNELFQNTKILTTEDTKIFRIWSP